MPEIRPRWWIGKRVSVNFLFAPARQFWCNRLPTLEKMIMEGKTVTGNWSSMVATTGVALLWAATMSQAADNLAPLEIKLPVPTFIGTLAEIRSRPCLTFRSVI